MSSIMERMFTPDSVYRRPWFPPERSEPVAKKDIKEIPEMKPRGKIFLGLVEEIEKVRWSDGALIYREIKTGKVVPGLRVQMVGQKESEPLSEVCARAADAADKKLREIGLLPKMPQSFEAIQGRG